MFTACLSEWEDHSAQEGPLHTDDEKALIPQDDAPEQPRAPGAPVPPADLEAQQVAFKEWVIQRMQTYVQSALSANGATERDIEQLIQYLHEVTTDLDPIQTAALDGELHKIDLRFDVDESDLSPSEPPLPIDSSLRGLKTGMASDYVDPLTGVPQRQVSATQHYGPRAVAAVGAVIWAWDTRATDNRLLSRMETSSDLPTDVARQKCAHGRSIQLLPCVKGGPALPEQQARNLVGNFCPDCFDRDNDQDFFEIQSLERGDMGECRHWDPRHHGMQPRHHVMDRVSSEVALRMLDYVDSFLATLVTVPVARWIIWKDYRLLRERLYSLRHLSRAIHHQGRQILRWEVFGVARGIHSAIRTLADCTLPPADVQSAFAEMALSAEGIVRLISQPARAVTP